MDPDRRASRPRRGPGAGRRLRDNPALLARVDRTRVSVSRQLDALMDAGDWSQDRLAAAAGVHRQTVLDLLKTRSNCELATLARLADALGCELRITFHRVPPPPSAAR
jgi:DNA-binding XRE family transcriptional regulator